eukprot:3180376-Pleurochrysis_carterae.AAC.2
MGTRAHMIFPSGRKTYHGCTGAHLTCSNGARIWTDEATPAAKHTQTSALPSECMRTDKSTTPRDTHPTNTRIARTGRKRLVCVRASTCKSRISRTELKQWANKGPSTPGISAAASGS